MWQTIGARVVVDVVVEDVEVVVVVDDEVVVDIVVVVIGAGAGSSGATDTHMRDTMRAMRRVVAISPMASTLLSLFAMGASALDSAGRMWL